MKGKGLELMPEADQDGEWAIPHFDPPPPVLMGERGVEIGL